MARLTPEQVQAYLEFNVFVQRIDRAGGAERGGTTWWQVVDRITRPVGATRGSSAIVGDYDSEETANTKCDELREKHTPAVIEMVI